MKLKTIKNQISEILESVDCDTNDAQTDLLAIVETIWDKVNDIDDTLNKVRGTGSLNYIEDAHDAIKDLTALLY